MFKNLLQYVCTCKFVVKNDHVTDLTFQGKEVIEFYINEVISQGTTYIPPWTGPPAEKLPITDKKESLEAGGVRERSPSSGSVQSFKLAGASAGESSSPPEGI